MLRAPRRLVEVCRLRDPHSRDNDQKSLKISAVKSIGTPKKHPRRDASVSAPSAATLYVPLTCSSTHRMLRLSAYCTTYLIKLDTVKLPSATVCTGSIPLKNSNWRFGENFKRL